MQAGPSEVDLNSVKRKFAGNIAFYQHLQRSRVPCYLQRNIKAFFRYHRSNITPIESRDSDTEMVPVTPTTNRVSRARTWDPAEILHIIEQKKFARDNPYFHLDVKSIKDSRKSFLSSTPQGTPEKASKQPKLEDTHATCGLTIWEGFPNVVLVQESVPCTIRVHTRQESGERYAKVELERPFRVYCQELVPKSGKPSAAQPYSMQLTLQARDVDTPWPPVDLHKVPPPKEEVKIDADGSQVRFPFFVTNYSRFPNVPSKEEEALLHVTAWQDSKQYKPKLCLQIDAGWVEPTKPSDTYDEWQRRKSADAKKTSAPARKAAPSKSSSVPAFSLASSELGIRIRTTWIMRHQNIHVAEHTFDGFICPLCNGKEFNGTDIYYAHLVMAHDIFRFDIDAKYPREKDNDSKKLRITVKVEIKNTYETPLYGPKKEDGENFTRIASSNGVIETLALKSFHSYLDLQQYLEQDRSKNWDKSRGHDRRTQNGNGSRSGSAFDSGRATPTVADLTRPADKVPDLVPPRRKRYPVPRAPEGVTFFSLRVKRPLTEGELLSESDDEIDDDWLLEKHDARINGSTDLTREEKHFIKRHDRHMLREKVTSNLQYREALVRFCRLNKGWLSRPEVRRQFIKKLSALILEGVIKLQQQFEYMSIINNCSISEREAGTVGEDADMSSQAGTTSTLRFYSRCTVCGDPIRTLSDIERCSNSHCFNDCHLACSDRLFGQSDADSPNEERRCRYCLGLYEEETDDQLPDVQTSTIVDSLDGTSDPREFNAPNHTHRYHGNNQALVDLANEDANSHHRQRRTPPPSLPAAGHGFATPTQQFMRPPDRYWSGSPQGPGTRYQPITLEEDDFPVGRDKARIQQSRISRSTASPTRGTYNNNANRAMGFVRMDGMPGLELSRSYHGYTAAEMSNQASVTTPKRQARRPHEL